MLRVLVFVEFAKRAPARVHLTSQVKLMSGHDRARDDSFANASLVGSDVRVALVMLESSEDRSTVDVGGALQMWPALRNGA